MTTVSDIIDFLESIAPQAWKMDWDNCGLLLGSKDKKIKRILIALDPFEDTAQEAVRIHADMILTHHPLIFMPVHNITDETSIGRTILLLAKHDIAAVNAHTNLDVAPEGVNAILAQKLGLKEITVIDPIGTDRSGKQYGLLRKGTVDEQELGSFLAHVKEALACPGLRYVSGNKPVRNVAVGGGACADEMVSAVRAGCDTFVTSDVKYNPFWDANDMGLNLIDAGHFYTENPVCEYLKTQIAAAFPNLDIVLSQEHRDCMKFFI